MVYVPTNWQDGITPVNAANLNKLEQGLAAAVGIPADVVVPAANLLIRNRFSGADANHGFRLQGDGRLDWGPGGAAAPDTTLHRVNISQLATDGFFYAKYNQPEQVILGHNGSFPQAGIAFGNPLDTNLYRASASNLKSDGSLYLGNALVVDHNGGGGKIYFGSSLDTTFYRESAFNLKTNATLKTEGSLVIDTGAGGNKLYFTDALDTNLYRSAARVLATDATLDLNRGPGAPALRIFLNAGETYAALGFDRDGKMSWGAGGATGPDTYLYRVGAKALQSDGSFFANGGLFGVGGSAAGSLAFGAAATGDTFNRFSVNNQGYISWGPGNAAGDTSLYRALAGQLTTPGGFSVGGTLQAGVGLAYNNVAYYTLVSGDAGIRQLIRNHGALEWGDGTGTLDTTLARLSPGVLGINGVAIGGGATILRKNTIKQVINTAAAVDLLNGEITLPALTANKMVRFSFWGDWINNVGGLSIPRMQLILGGVTLLDTGTAGATNGNPTRLAWHITGVISNAGATNAQTVKLNYSLGIVQSGNNSLSAAVALGIGLWNTGAGGAGNGAEGQLYATNTGLSVDTSVARALVLNVINGTASAAYDTRLFGALVEVI